MLWWILGGIWLFCAVLVYGLWKENVKLWLESDDKEAKVVLEVVRKKGVSASILYVFIYEMGALWLILLAPLSLPIAVLVFLIKGQKLKWRATIPQLKAR